MTAGNAGTATASSSGYENDGVGGKFRRWPFSRNGKTTPYDRPLTALRSRSWVKKLVLDPATKLISYGAQRSEGSAFSELEQLLKQKTFSRFRCSTCLSNVNFLPLLHVPSPGLFLLLHLMRIFILINNRKLEAITLMLLLPGLGSMVKVPKRNVASPAELAKAYIGTRPSKASPSFLSSQSQVVRDTPLLKNAAYSQNLPITSVTTNTAGVVGVRANGFTTRRSCGRSAIYHMARTPYSRLHQTDDQMACSSTYSAYSGTSLSESVLKHDGYFGSKQLVKRRSSDLEDDIGSIGPIRRTRQKPNLLSHATSRPSPGAGAASAAADVPTGYVHIPPKPSETAAKLLEHLENLTPKEKSSESRLVAGKAKTPKKSTPNMLRGQALKSLESLDSPKLLQSAQESHKLENWSTVVPTNAHDSSLQKQDKMEQHRQNESINGSIVVAKNNEKISLEDAQHVQQGVEAAESLNKESSTRPQKKHAFRMSALELFCFYEDINSAELASQLVEGRDKMGVSDAEKKPLSTDEVLNKPAAVFETKATVGISKKRNDMEALDAAVINVNNTSFLPNSNPLTPEVVPPSFGADKSKEPSGGKVPALLFSSSSPPSVLRPESSSSLSNPALGLAGASSKLFESDNSQKDGKSNGKIEPLSSGFSPSTLFASPSSTSSFSNGQFAPSPAISSTSFLTSSNSPKDVPSGSSSEVAPSTSISAAVGSTTGNCITSGGGLFGFAAVSSVSTESLISSGPSEVPPIVSTLSTTLSTTFSADNADLKTKATSFGNFNSSSPFASSSFASASPGNSSFGFSSSGMSTVTTTSIQSQGSLFSTGAQSLVSVQTSLAGSDNTRVSQSVPAHFGSPTTLPKVRNSGMTSFSSVGSSSSNTGLVSAAASASNPVGSSAATFGNFSFGTSSSASSTMVASVGPGSGTTQPVFAFGASPAVSAATSALATSSNATSAMFSFGVNSSSSSAKAIDTSTRPSPSTFNFGDSSSASSLNNVSTSNSAAPGIFSFGGGSSASSTDTISTSINATPAIFSFGGSSSASSTNTVSTSTSAIPGMFSFGGSSSASSTNTVSTSTSATPGMFSFGASSSVSSTNTVSTSTNATPSIFSLGDSSSVSSANAVNASSIVGSNPFAFSASSASPQTSSTAGIFSSNWQAPKSPGFGSPFSSATPTVFGFGASSSSFAAPTTTAAVFGSTPSTPSGPAFPFGSTSLTNSSPQPIFGNSNSPFTASPGNNNQMNMEDSMAEDTMNASSPAFAFSQPSVSPSPGGFGFGSTPNQLQFGSQLNQTVAQNPSPFAASGSFGGGGSFSLGSNDPDKSGRKIVKVSRNKNRKK
ncbi:hypothetical protein CQW23_02771 [Capsicum baccatum]|uniref:Nuclear pore complex protein NUP1 n=1 Tax=Capsicum baccatum TaxID=33114 RepID=A0A2G2XSF5_CAPBA|nr:hypothetical protein CQW23_02771 [Capsicum baccatum]